MANCGVLAIWNYEIIGGIAQPGGNIPDSYGRAKNRVIVIKG